MATRSAEIQHNLNTIKQAIHASVTGSNISRPVRLVAVSKLKPVSDILEAFNAGQIHFGENYVQELAEKSSQLPKEIKWHFIGSCQSNKLKLLASIPNLFLIETIDSLKKATILNKAVAAESKDRRMNIYLQINTSGEDSKSGLDPNECVGVAKDILHSCENLSLAGLMTIGSRESSQAGGTNPDFECLRSLKGLVEKECQVGDLELSMGMSDDFQSAIRQGSTSVRVGSKIFGART